MSKPKEDKDIKIPDNILRELLTPSEMRMVKNRYRIMNLLEKGLSVRSIAEEVEVGTDTVVRVSKAAEAGVLKIDRKKKDIKTSTPWIFGKSGQ